MYTCNTSTSWWQVYEMTSASPVFWVRVTNHIWLSWLHLKYAWPHHSCQTFIAQIRGLTVSDGSDAQGDLVLYMP